jgi:hypothetical protein
MSRVVSLTLVVLLVTTPVSHATEVFEHVHAFPILSLLVDSSAKASGMGGCAITLTDDPASALEHPASLAFIRGRFAASGSYMGIGPGYGEGYTHRFTGGAARIGKSATVGASYVGLPLGTVHIWGADNPSGIGHEIDMGERLYSFAGAVLWGDLGVGLGFENIRSDQGQDLTALPEIEEIIYEGWRWSAGARYRRSLATGTALVLAAGVRHAGPDLDAPWWSEFVMPAGVSAGASVRSEELVPVPVSVHIQVDDWLWPNSDDAWETDAVWRIGSELELAPVFGAADRFHGGMAFRFGHVFDGLTGIDGWTWGGSFELASARSAGFGLDFANVPPRMNENGDRLWQIGLRLSSGY